MGKGDLRSKRGKIHRGTYGNNRLRKKTKAKRARRQAATGGSGSSSATSG
jgi:ribosomal small subunit protein bTHX